MLVAGRCKFVVMRGAKFRYRSARLIGFRLDIRTEKTAKRKKARSARKR
jgi:hypothetical protein